MRSYEPPDWARMIQVFGKAVDRMQAGAKEYGEFRPEEDTRDLLEECREEILDGINYLGMMYLKLEHLSQKLEHPLPPPEG